MKGTKYLGLAMIIFMIFTGSIFSVFAGGGQQNSKINTVNEATILNPLGNIPIVKENIALKIGMVRNPVIQDYPTTYETKELEKDSNIKLDFVFYGATSQEANQKIELEFAAGGKDLPDIINLGFTAASAQYYGEQGMIIQLDNYVKNSISYSKKSIDELGYDIWKYLKTPDGHIYTLFQVQQELASDIYTRLYTNKNWMLEVNKPMPTTIAEFTDLLRAFKNHNFNNNGTKEYAFIGDRATTLSHRFFNALITPFVYCNNTDNYLYKDDGNQISAMYAAEGFRQALLYIRSLVDEGLIDPLSFTQDQEQLKAIANSTNGYCIGMSSNYPLNWYSASDPRSRDWVLIDTLAGPDGKRVAPFSGIRPSRQYAITKNCQYPETAFRLGDMLMSEKYSMITRYGEEGVDRKPPPPGAKSFYADYPVTSIPTLDWNIPNNKRWESNQPYILTYRMSASVAAVGLISGLEEWSNVMAADCMPFVQREREIGPINFSPKELSDTAEIMSNLSTYWVECFTRFVLRDMSIENDWNKYLGELKTMGLDTYINAVRAAYSRM